VILCELDRGVRKTKAADPVFEQEYDLIVAGLGTAGAIALIAAGRAGLSVLGVEQLYGMGGTGTIGAITGYYFGAEGGLYQEIDGKASALEEGLFVKGSRRDSKALVLEREARAAGAELKFHCIVTGVYKEGRALKGLRLFHQGRALDLGAKNIIDATGEAAVCHIAGARSSTGRPFDHSTQPFTFTSIAMDTKGKVFGMNRDSGYVRQNDPGAVSGVIIKANNYPLYLRDDYSKEEIKFLTIAPLLGVREGRLIQGRTVLRLRDIISLEHQFAPPLFYTYSNVDNHGKDLAFEGEELCEWCAVAGLWGVLFSVPVPLDALIPDNLENIVAAGRCLSVDHSLAGAVRMMRDMAKCGEAAAAVCVEAVRSGKAPHDVDYAPVAELLKKTGCLDEGNNLGFVERVASRYPGEKLPPVHTREELIPWLDSDKPGWGIWQARALAARDSGLGAFLRDQGRRGSENLARNTALALGLMGNRGALEKLREMAGEPDNHIPKSSLKYVYTRGVSALYLLGKLGDRDFLEPLFGMVEGRGRRGLEGFEFNEFYQRDLDLFTLYVLFAARALLDIAEKHGDLKEEIHRRLSRIIAAPGCRAEVTLKENAGGLYDLRPALEEYIASRR
jgi:hypothetical protein